MVLDTSALLAPIFNEKKGLEIADLLEKNAHELSMSTVNLAEALILIEDRQPKHASEITDEILSSTIRFVPPTKYQAVLAAKARLKFPLNLGDCFAYALAYEEQDVLLTLDKAFLRTDLKLVKV